VVEAYFKALFQHLSGWNEGTLLVKNCNILIKRLSGFSNHKNWNVVI